MNQKKQELEQYLKHKIQFLDTILTDEYLPTKEKPLYIGQKIAYQNIQKYLNTK